MQCSPWRSQALPLNYWLYFLFLADIISNKINKLKKMLNCYENNNCLFLKSIVILRWFEPVQSIINVNAYVCLLVNYFLHRSMESTWCKLLKNSKDKIFCKMKDEIWRGRLCFYLIEASATYLSFRNILEYIHGTSTCYCLLLSICWVHRQRHTENLLNFESQK